MEYLDDLFKRNGHSIPVVVVLVMTVELKSVAQHFDNLVAEQLLDQEEWDHLYHFEEVVAAREQKTIINH